MIKTDLIETKALLSGKWKLLYYLPLIIFVCRFGYWEFLVWVIVGLGVFEIMTRRPFSFWTKISVVQMLSLLTILSFPTNEAWLLFLTVFVNDAGAFYGGTYLNYFYWMKLHIFPVSPDKTLGGFLYGLFFCCLTGYLVVYFLDLPNYGFQSFLAICCVATAGDLLGSGFKRHYKLKESGQGLFTEKWMCKHGGILDRFDSLPVVCLFWLVLKLFN